MAEHLRRGQRGRVRFLWGLLLGSLALVALVWALVLERLNYEREGVVQDVVARNSTLALAFQEHSARAIEAADRVLLFMKRERETSGRLLSLPDLGADGTTGHSGFTSLTFVDEHGYAWLPSGERGPVNLADREYFQFHRANSSGGLHIAKPAVGRLSGSAVIIFSRRVNMPDGSFGGICILGVEPEYLLSMLQQLELGPSGMVALVGKDGVVRVRHVGNRTTHGQPVQDSPLLRQAAAAPQGSFVSAGLVEAVPRYMSYRSLPAHPFIVAVGVAVDSVEAAVAAKARAYYAGASLATLLLAGLAAILGFALHRERLAKAKQTELEARYRATFDQAALGIIHADLEGRFTMVNRTFCAMLGYAEKELLGRKFTEITHADDVGASLARPRRLLEEPGAAVAPDMEKRYLRKDGSTLFASSALTLVRDARGGPAYFIAMVHDITARKEAEKQLRDSEARFRSLTELSSDFYWETDAEHRFVGRGGASTSSAIGIFTRGEQMGLRRWEVPYLSPGEDGWRAHRAVLDAHQPFRDFEFSRRGDDGTERHLCVSGDPVFDPEGRFTGYRGVGSDVTERKAAERALRESERRFRDMLDDVELVAVMLDCEGIITYCNDYLLQLTGWTREEVVGRSWFEVFIPGESAPQIERAFAALLAGDPSTRHYENDICTRSGERRSIKWSNTVLRSAGGEVTGTANIGEDVTERKAAEHALREQLDELWRFHNVTVDREIRMEELEAEISRLKGDRVAGAA